MLRRNFKRLRVESLEDRRVFAGNVAASAGEVLELRGDEAANEVRITQDASDRILIEGLNGTTINGRSSVRFNGAGLEKVDIKLFGGNDKLTVRSLRASVDQNIELGAGDDVVSLNRVVAGANLSVKADDGYDRLDALGLRVSGDFYAEMGQGRSGVSIASSRVGKTLTVIGGDSTDLTTIAQTTSGDLNVEAKKGADRVDLVDVRSRKNIKVDVDLGSDTVAVQNVYAAHDAVFLGGDGFDTFQDRGVSAGEKLEIKQFERIV